MCDERFEEISSHGCVLAIEAVSQAVLLDFSTDDFGTPLVNGQDISTPPEFGNFVAITDDAGGNPNHLGAAIFNSDPAGPNSGGPDFDLLVNLGNILILQSTVSPTQTTAGIFDVPNDSVVGGTVFFNFPYYNPAEMESLDLIDINGNMASIVTLWDGGGLSRTYSVPSEWTKDVFVSGPDGYDTLDLTTLAPQLGEGGSTATAVEDAGFDPTDVWTMSVQLIGSGALDNVQFIPEPATLTLLGLGGASLLRRRRHV